MRKINAWIYVTLDGVVEAPESWVIPDDEMFGAAWHPSERLRRWAKRPRTWLYECKLCRARFTKTSYCWPCEPITPPHDTFHEVTARRVYCIGSLCIGRVLGPA